MRQEGEEPNPISYNVSFSRGRQRKCAPIGKTLLCCPLARTCVCGYYLFNVMCSLQSLSFGPFPPPTTFTQRIPPIETIY